MEDESAIDWASGWVRDNTPEDPTFRQRFIDGLTEELRSLDALLDALDRSAAAPGAISHAEAHGVRE
jgi:hypothetical protein